MTKLSSFWTFVALSISLSPCLNAFQSFIRREAATFVGGRSTRVGSYSMRRHAQVSMIGSGAPTTYQGARIGPPPDLPSLLLHNRIIYIGMPLVPQVTELVIAELLFLNYESATKPIKMYINSPGTMNARGQSVGFETEAFAIADVMNYVKPPVHTIVVGQAYGAAAMLLAMGQKGKRYALPNSSIMLHQPRSQARGQASDIAIKAREVLTNRRVTCELLAKSCGRDIEEVIRDAGRTKYLSPTEAKEYGMIDHVVGGKMAQALEATKVPTFMDKLN